jgi:hypothetical protein
MPESVARSTRTGISGSGHIPLQLRQWSDRAKRRSKIAIGEAIQDIGASKSAELPMNHIQPINVTPLT